VKLLEFSRFNKAGRAEEMVRNKAKKRDEGWLVHMRMCYKSALSIYIKSFYTP
jgi:hypothetical protein